ncbi:MAG: hypothetical protein AAB242_08780 [Nitrospirota bacterium]
MDEKNSLPVEVFSVYAINPTAICQGYFGRQDFPKIRGTDWTVKKDLEVIGKSFPSDFKKSGNPLSISYATDKIPKAAKIGKSNRKVFPPAKSPSAKTALVTDLSASGFAKPDRFSLTEWTADSVSPKDLYFFMKRLYMKL